MPERIKLIIEHADTDEMSITVRPEGPKGKVHSRTLRISKNGVRWLRERASRGPRHAWLDFMQMLANKRLRQPSEPIHTFTVELGGSMLMGHWRTPRRIVYVVARGAQDPSSQKLGRILWRLAMRNDGIGFVRKDQEAEYAPWFKWSQLDDFFAGVQPGRRGAARAKNPAGKRKQ